MATRGSCVHISMVEFSGGIPKNLVLCNFFRILMVSDKMIHRAFRTHTTLFKQNQSEIFFSSIFTIYQNYTLALRHFLSVCTLNKLQSLPCQLSKLQGIWYFKEFKGAEVLGPNHFRQGGGGVSEK